MITKTDILAKVPQVIVDSKDESAIAAIFNVGRTKLIDRRIGVGTILETLGIAAGNTFLDVVFNTPDFRYVKFLIERSELNIGSQLVQTTIDSLVPGVLSRPNADALKALGVVEDPVSPYEISLALEQGL